MVGDGRPYKKIRVNLCPSVVLLEALTFIGWIFRVGYWMFSFFQHPPFTSPGCPVVAGHDTMRTDKPPVLLVFYRLRCYWFFIASGATGLFQHFGRSLPGQNIISKSVKYRRDALFLLQHGRIFIGLGLVLEIM